MRPTEPAGTPRAALEFCPHPPTGPPTMPGKFEIYTAKNGEYRWRLKATNGITIASSGEGYKARASCLNGIKSVQKNAPAADLIDLDKQAEEEAKAAAEQEAARDEDGAAADKPAKKTTAKKSAAKKSGKKKAAKAKK